MKLLQNTLLVIAMTVASIASIETAAAAANNTSLQQFAKRPYLSQQVAALNKQAQADRLWEAATMQTTQQPDVYGVTTSRGQWREQLNFQFASKRPYLQPEKL